VITTTKPKSGFFIGVGCPGCGGDLDLEADFFVTECEHCGSPLRVIMPDVPPAFMMRSAVARHELRFHIDRYLKEHGLPLTNSTLQIKRLYYPYWKVDGTVLKLRNKTETKTIYSETDSSVESTIESDRSTVSVSPYSVTIAAGTSMEGIPETIGMRAETIRVIPFADENLEDDFDALPILRPWEIVRQKVNAAVSSMSLINPADFGTNLTRLFNQSFSLIYFPYYVVECYGQDYVRFVLDGLVGRVIKAIYPEDAFAESEKPPEDPVEDRVLQGVVHELMAVDDSGTLEPPPEVAFGQLDVDFHRCTVCGSDLPTVQSHVYICSNCLELQVLDRNNATLPGIEVAEFEDDASIRLIPFWRLRLPEIMTGRFGNLLGGLDKGEDLLVPATGASNFEGVHKLARRMSVAQGRMTRTMVEKLDERYLPVRIGRGQALALAEMIVCRELVDHGHKLPEEGLELVPSEVGLVYVPFRQANYFYVDTVINAVSAEKSLIE
jgi:hypothetical protein